MIFDCPSSYRSIRICSGNPWLPVALRSVEGMIAIPDIQYTLSSLYLVS